MRTHLSNKTVGIISLICLTWSNIGLAATAVVLVVKAYRAGFANCGPKPFLLAIGCLVAQQCISQIGHKFCVRIDQEGW